MEFFEPIFLVHWELKNAVFSDLEQEGGKIISGLLFCSICQREKRVISANAKRFPTSLFF